MCEQYIKNSIIKYSLPGFHNSIPLWRLFAVHLQVHFSITHDMNRFFNLDLSIISSQRIVSLQHTRVEQTMFIWSWIQL
uniref:Uncharacterized protein n=1 Tax=Oryza brachyantha TaxID=4533 RepID=J3LE65_ORYBR